MSNKKMARNKVNTDLEKRLSRSASGQKRGNGTSLEIGSVEGDTGIRYVPINLLDAAPEGWNFYSQLNKIKNAELVKSIIEKGLMYNIVVWEQEDTGRYTILAGHNRVRIFQELDNNTGVSEYSKIPAKIYRHAEIDETDAREIIIDTNWAQRDLTPMEKARSICEKHLILQKRKEKEIKEGKRPSIEGRLRDHIGQQFKISGRQLAEYQRLIDLVPGFQDMVGRYELSITVSSRIAQFDRKTQQWLYENHRAKLTYHAVRRLSLKMGHDEIVRVLKEVNEDKKKPLPLKINNDIIGLYKSLSAEDKMLLKAKIEDFIQELSIVQDEGGREDQETA